MVLLHFFLDVEEVGQNQLIFAVKDLLQVLVETESKESLRRSLDFRKDFVQERAAYSCENHFIDTEGEYYWPKAHFPEEEINH